MNELIHIIPTEGVPDFFRRRNTVFLLDASIVSPAELESLNLTLQSEGIPYAVTFHGSAARATLADYIGGDIICPLFGVNNRERAYLISTVEGKDVPSVVRSVVEAAISSDREYLEEILIAAAFNNPTAFSDSNTGKRAGNKGSAAAGVAGGLLRLPVMSLSACALGLCAGAGFDVVEGLADGNGLDASAGDDPSAFLPGSQAGNTMSSMRKKLLLSKLPEKVSERFIKQNPARRKEIEALIASVSHQDLQEIVMELITRQKGALSIFDFERLSAASEYGICVRRRDKSCSSDFDPKFKYCLYLKDRQGREIPVKFQNHPAYCLYIMYVIDRAIRGEKATYLSIRQNKDEFIRLYQEIFGFSAEDAAHKYSTFSYRLNKEGTPTRKGRYDDYLKDIDQTIVSLVGRADSIPLKLRDGGHLEIKPERITIDEHLRSFKFR